MSLLLLFACVNRYARDVGGRVFECLSLQPEHTYIFYEGIQQRSDQTLWAFDLDTTESVPLQDQFFSLQRTPPQNGRWLLTDRNIINFLELESCQIGRLYTLDPKYQTLDAVWVNGDQLLINAFDDYPYSADLYLFDMRTDSVEKLASGEYIQAVSPPRSEWIQTDGVTIQAVSTQGQKRQILKDFIVSIGMSPGEIQFLPNGNEFIFVGLQKGNDQVKVWKSSLTKDVPEVLLERNINSTFPYFEISPDGKYLGLVEQSEGYSLIFMNLNTDQIDFEWKYPFTRTNPEFRWSPDSKFIAMSYEGTGDESPPGLFQGIQIMEIETGNIQVVLQAEINGVISWLGKIK